MNLGKSSSNGKSAMENNVVQESVLAELRNHFRPEFLNRIDDVILFHSLSRDQIKGIVEVQMNDLRKRLEEKRMTLTLTDKARDALADKGYDPAFGARPLKRAIQKYIQDPLSKEILEETLRDGDAIEIDWDSESEAFLIRKAEIVQQNAT
jgi:ATP-dependent Clp protease ATP-binding subunit ClpA